MGDAVEQLLRDAVAALPSRASIERGDQVFVLTGATGKIGAAIAQGIFKANVNVPTVSHLVLIVKDETEKLAALDIPRRYATSVAGAQSEALKVDVLVADLAKPASVATCCAGIRKEYPKVDVLINCAAAVSKTRVEVDGLELQFATNVLGSFVLMRELMLAMPRS